MNNFVPRLKKLISANGLILCLFTVTFAVFFVGMPRYLDDLWYSSNIRNWLEGKPDASLWEGFKATWIEHFTIDNVRLANIVCVPFMALPKWIGSGIAALFTGLSVVWATRMAGADPFRSPLFPICIFLWTFCLPWYDSMGVENFQFNYVYSTVIALWVILVFFRLDNRKRNIWKYGLLGLFAGLWHEGFTASLIGGFSAVLILFPSTRNKASLWLMAGLIAGMIWQLAWPCSWERASDVMGENSFGLGRLLFLSFQHPALLIALLLCFIMACRAKWRKYLYSRLTVTLIVNAFVCFIIHFLTTRTSRTGWWAEVCSIIFILTSLRALFPDFWSRYKLKNILVIIPLLALTLVHQVLVDYYTIRIAKIFNTAIDRHIRSGENVVFTEVLDEHNSPLICMYAPDFTTMLAPVNFIFINTYYHADNQGQFIPVPQELRDFTLEKGEKIPPVPGGEDMDLRKYKGRLVIPTTEEYQGEFEARVDFGYTVKDGVRIVYMPFISEADGKRYAFIYPWRRVVEMRLGDIHALSPTSEL